MGRARKETDASHMRQRLADAFWELLEDHELNDITVGDVVGVAGCNRGSFYYYYDSRDDFIKAIVRDDFIGRCGLFRFIFQLMAGDNPKLLGELDKESFERLSLLMRHGGSGIVEDEVKAYAMDLWSAVLCLNGEKLQPETLEIIEFLVNGLLGVVVGYDGDMPRHSPGVSQDFLQAVMENAIRSIGQIQGVAEDEILMRIQVLGKYRKMDSDRRQSQTALV